MKCIKTWHIIFACQIWNTQKNIHMLVLNLLELTRRRIFWSSLIFLLLTRRLMRIYRSSYSPSSVSDLWVICHMLKLWCHLFLDRQKYLSKIGNAWKFLVRIWQETKCVIKALSNKWLSLLKFWVVISRSKMKSLLCLDDMFTLQHQNLTID